MRKSIALRLAVMFALAAIGGFALIGVALHHVLGEELARHQREEAQARLEDVRFMLERSRSVELALRARQKMKALTDADPRTRYWMWSDDATYRYGEEAERVAGLTRVQRGVIDLPLGVRGRRVAVLGADLPANDIRPALRLMVGVDGLSFEQTLDKFESALVVFTLTGAMIVAGLGYWIAMAGLKPALRMSAEAQRVGPANPGQRLKLPALPRELSDLGCSFNAALDRLDAAYHQLETFNADVAHELRTPLANLIGQTQVALSREREAFELREVLQSNLEELERLRTIVADMLFLARAEQGERAKRLVETSLAGEVGKTVEFLDLLLDEARLSVGVSGDAVAPIETSLIRRALTNLLQNAIQHSPPGSHVEVHIGAEGGRATVAFSNPAEPIASEHLARLFDRFYRGDAARPNSGESHGLGLAIVKAIAAMHGGSVFAVHDNGVVTVGFSVALTS